MKRAFILIISIIHLMNGFNQTYHPIPSNNVYWIEYETGLFTSNFNCNFETYRYIYPTGSVNIHGTNYTQFKQNSVTSYYWALPGTGTCPGPIVSTGDHYAFIRNDSAAKKVYLYDTVTTQQEILLYDFSAQLGDSMSLTSGSIYAPHSCPGEDSAVVSVDDSVDLGGEFRRRLIVYPINNSSDTLIEGMGSSSGFALNIYCSYFVDYYYSKLICYHHNNLSYGNVSSPYCTTSLSINDHLPSIQSIVFQITGDEYYIQNTSLKDLQISCYDMVGKLVLEKTFEESGIMYFSEIPSGVYVMYIESNGQTLKPYKFVVSH